MQTASESWLFDSKFTSSNRSFSSGSVSSLHAGSPSQLCPSAARGKEDITNTLELGSACWAQESLSGWNIGWMDTRWKKLGPHGEGLEYHDVNIILQGVSTEYTQRSVLDTGEINWRNKSVFFSCKLLSRLGVTSIYGKEKRNNKKATTEKYFWKNR